MIAVSFNARLYDIVHVLLNVTCTYTFQAYMYMSVLGDLAVYFLQYLIHVYIDMQKWFHVSHEKLEHSYSLTVPHSTAQMRT